MRNLIIFYLAFLAIGCADTAIEENGNNIIKSSISSKKEEKTAFEYWVNEAYFECLAKDLPCKCISYCEYPVIKLSLGTGSAFLIDSNDNSEELYIKKESNNFAIYANPNDEKALFEAQATRDLLILRKDGVEYKYVRYPVQTPYPNKLVGFINTQQLREHLKDDFRVPDSSYIYCNKEIGGLNIISRQDTCKGAFVLEKNKEAVKVFDYINSCDSKVVPQKINKKLIANGILK